MKNVKLISATLIASALALGNASAMTNPEAPLQGVVGVNASKLTVRIDDGVATIFGSVDSQVESHLAKTYIQKMEGVDRVIDLVSVN